MLADAVDLEVAAEPGGVVAEAVVVEAELGVPPVAGEAEGLVEVVALQDVGGAVGLDVGFPDGVAGVVDDLLGAAALVGEEVVALA